MQAWARQMQSGVSGALARIEADLRLRELPVAVEEVDMRDGAAGRLDGEFHEIVEGRLAAGCRECGNCAGPAGVQPRRGAGRHVAASYRS